MKSLARKVFLGAAALGLGALSMQGCDPGKTAEPRPESADTAWADVLMARKIVADDVYVTIMKSPGMEAAAAKTHAYVESKDSLDVDVLIANEVITDTIDARVYSAPGIAGAAKRDTSRFVFVKTKKLITPVLDAQVYR